MLQTLFLWFHETLAGKFLLTIHDPGGGASCRSAGRRRYGGAIPLALLAGVLGNMLPVPFVILFIQRVFKLVQSHIPGLADCVDWLEKRRTPK